MHDFRAQAYARVRQPPRLRCSRLQAGAVCLSRHRLPARCRCQPQWYVREMAVPVGRDAVRDLAACCIRPQVAPLSNTHVRRASRRRQSPTDSRSRRQLCASSQRTLKLHIVVRAYQSCSPRASALRCAAVMGAPPAPPRAPAPCTSGVRSPVRARIPCAPATMPRERTSAPARSRVQRRAPMAAHQSRPAPTRTAPRACRCPSRSR